MLQQRKLEKNCKKGKLAGGVQTRLPHDKLQTTQANKLNFFPFSRRVKKKNWQDKLATINSGNKLTCQKKISRKKLVQQQNSATQTDAFKQNNLARQTTATKFGETNSRVATNKFSLRKQTLLQQLNLVGKTRVFQQRK